ncbi:hypothetical protein E2C01_100332 [Portunus trituberculatus]|uniref:Uncharacterized protein n=1 Tax=Portunus trituberculatus TaxID=210409 RepID=A0A5B7KD32_PORTR|nr:hypothetical protein [Portunus trituberculatus]
MKSRAPPQVIVMVTGRRLLIINLKKNEWTTNTTPSTTTTTTTATVGLKDHHQFSKSFSHTVMFPFNSTAVSVNPLQILFCSEKGKRFERTERTFTGFVLGWEKYFALPPANIIFMLRLQSI